MIMSFKFERVAQTSAPSVLLRQTSQQGVDRNIRVALRWRRVSAEKRSRSTPKTVEGKGRKVGWQ
jgi:hypothetical protein